jgi:hypothetical protein
MNDGILTRLAGMGRPMGVQIELLSMVHHKYLVSLLGHSCTRKHQILIYEYMAGGDLRHRLQGTCEINCLTTSTGSHFSTLINSQPTS